MYVDMVGEGHPQRPVIFIRIIIITMIIFHDQMKKRIGSGWFLNGIIIRIIFIIIIRMIILTLIIIIMKIIIITALSPE